jgi:hypothetical protein
MRIFYFLVFINIISTSQAQDYFFRSEQSIPVKVADTELLNPWSGGINSAQISKADLNNDGTEDLVIYDKTCNKLSTFIATENAGSFYFKHAPEYASLFPSLSYWVLLRDFNNDGKKDIFCGASGGSVKCYKNISGIHEKIKFEPAKNEIYTEGFSGSIPMYISVSDIPSITDVDNDGDLDFLSFDPGGGDFVQFNKNLSIETYGTSDSLTFKRIGDCWGNFIEGPTCNQVDFGVQCDQGEGKRVMHSGATILALDLDNDEDKDLITGTVECSNINRIKNDGTPVFADFTSSTDNFPNETDKPNLHDFLASFYEDLDFDNKKDLIISPNISSNEANLTPFHSSVWFYKNEGEQVPDFKLKSKNFLQNDIIDLGEFSYPALVDIDGDGDLDLLAGNHGKLQPTGEFFSTLTLFENIGTKESPSFRMENDDFLNLSTSKFLNIKPAFADINKDGKADFIFTSTNTSTGKASLSYIINTAASGIGFSGNPVNISFTFSNFDSPMLKDLDNDGDLDLLLGRAQGRLDYYKNDGTNENPVYTQVSSSAGGIGNSITARNLSAVVANLDQDGAEELLLSDQEGNFRIVTNFEKDLTGTFSPQKEILFDENTETYKQAIVGKEVYPAVGDLNNDGFLEIILGTVAGGLILWKNEKAVLGNEKPLDSDAFLIYPNPAGNEVTIKSQYPGSITLLSVTGQQILSKQLNENLENKINTSGLAKGVYIVRFIDNGLNQQTRKLILN